MCFFLPKIPSADEKSRSWYDFIVQEPSLALLDPSDDCLQAQKGQVNLASVRSSDPSVTACTSTDIMAGSRRMAYLSTRGDESRLTFEEVRGPRPV